MQIDQFWNLIERSKHGTEGCEQQVATLVRLLEELEPEEIINFDNYVAKMRVAACRWDLWAVAYIINGGCSDDGFEYFRCWLISQGKEFFDAVLMSPERVAERVAEGEDAECEQFLYAAAYAYENKVGRELPATHIDYTSEPQGERWSEDDLEHLFPQLCQRYWGEDESTSASH